MNAVLEFHDSEVRNVESNANSLTVMFSAAHVHRTDGQSGGDAMSGYVQSLEMKFSGATWIGPVAECMGRLSAGKVVANGVARSRLELPYAFTGNLTAELQFSNGSQLGSMLTNTRPSHNATFACGRHVGLLPCVN